MLIVEDLHRNEYDNNIKYEYYYRLTEDKIEFSEMDYVQITSYGIEIERQDIVEGKIVKIERDSIKNISPHIYKVKKLLEMLYNNIVSPIHLVDVLGEYIDEYVIDFDEVLKNIYIC